MKKSFDEKSQIKATCVTCIGRILKEHHFFTEHHVYLLYRIANIKNNAMAAVIIGFLTSIAPVLVVRFGAMQVVRGQLTE